MQRLIVVAGICLLLFAVAYEAKAQAWTDQGPSGCSDQFGNFDAFVPGMRGHGSCNRGGFVPGTNVIVVSNRNSSGSGSFRDAISSSVCPKVILFAVSGVIDLAGWNVGQTAVCDNWSIVGASAPGNVTITGASNVGFKPRGSYWTVDNLTITGGSTDDAVAIAGTGDDQGYGIILNSTFLWGEDETVSCYPPNGETQTNILYWQNILTTVIGTSPGFQIIQNNCQFNASIRNLYLDGKARFPLVRGDGYFHSNNVHVNAINDFLRIQPCEGGIYGSPEPNTRMAVMDSLFVEGDSTGAAGQSGYIRIWDSTSCTNLTVYEDGNRAMASPGNIVQNCANHGCTSGFASNEFAGSPISSIHPAGYVSENIGSSQQELVNFAAHVAKYAGARPADRLSYIQTKVDHAINTIDGAGPTSNYSVSTSVTSEGGIGVLSSALLTYDPTDGSDNACGEDMPTGAAASAMQSSGLTRLHEWITGCFYDNVMPAGYREDGLQNYGAPTGGGSLPPIPSPSPPVGLSAS